MQVWWRSIIITSDLLIEEEHMKRARNIAYRYQDNLLVLMFRTKFSDILSDFIQTRRWGLILIKLFPVNCGHF